MNIVYGIIAFTLLAGTLAAFMWQLHAGIIRL